MRKIVLLTVALFSALLISNHANADRWIGSTLILDGQSKLVPTGGNTYDLFCNAANKDCCAISFVTLHVTVYAAVRPTVEDPNPSPRDYEGTIEDFPYEGDGTEPIPMHITLDE